MTEERTTVLIDWLTFSFPKDTVTDLFDGKTDDRAWHKQIARTLTNSDAEFVTRSGLHGYNTAYEAARGVVVAWGMPLQSNGAYVSFPGEYLAEHNALDIARHCLELGGRCTRLDIATDSYGREVLPDTLYNIADAGGAQTLAQKRRLVRSNTGSTLYIGSRTSERFLRVYEKGKKEGQQPDWVRAELELKGGKATNTLLYLLDAGVGDIPAVITSFWDIQHSGWADWMDCDTVVEIASNLKRSNTREWLLEAVPGALAREVAKEPAFLDEFLSRVEQSMPMEAHKRLWGIDN